MKKEYLGLLISAMLASPAMGATPTTWTTTYDSAVYGSYGTIKFNDWGYKGPQNVGASDFQVGSGFDSSRIGQIQHVVTTGPDWKTPDAPHQIYQDMIDDEFPPYPNANMDSTVNFYKWAYTTKAGSTFNNMQIDKAGNYNIAKSDMSFQFYDNYLYNNGVDSVQNTDSNINFQPYAISDAKGWCGSVLSSDPEGLEKMAGQVTFDFAFDVFTNNTGIPGQINGEGATTQVIPGFVMRSYGSYEVDVTTGDPSAPGDRMHYTGSAVINNTNPDSTSPLAGQLDPAYQGKVSFLGAGVIPLAVWVLNEGTADVQIVAEGTPGATLHVNTFGGFAFMLRADGIRILDYVPTTGHSDYVATTGAFAPVPVPAAAWLLGSGLLGLAGFVRRRNASV